MSIFLKEIDRILYKTVIEKIENEDVISNMHIWFQREFLRTVFFIDFKAAYETAILVFRRKESTNLQLESLNYSTP